MRPSTLLSILPVALAAPAPLPNPVAAPLPVPQGRVTNPLTGIIGSIIQAGGQLGSLSSAVPAVVSDLAQVLDAAGTVTQAIANGTLFGTDVPAAVQKLFQAAQPTARPTSIPDAIQKAAAAHGIKDANSPPTPQNLLTNALALVMNGFTTSDVILAATGGDPFANSYNNNNRAVPAGKRFYNRVSGDAPFSVSEDRLRAALYIPPGFTWGQKQPVVMSPGTGGTGAVQFQYNIGKLLARESFAEPVYLNIPDALLSDAQISAEYVSYALQYLKATTNRNPAIVTWSQGSIDTQWALKYWPSVRKIVTDHIAVAPDYHGTVLAYALCPGFALGSTPACVPSVHQQTYNSKFITKLRSNGGDSAYVPVTTVYSGVDEIVQPQQGTAASGYLLDARGAGVSNTYLQGACLGQAGGTVYTHEGTLYSPVAYALVVDALTHDGPGSFDRVKAQCSNLVANGLSLSDVVATEALIPLALLNIVAYTPKVYEEPAFKSYAV